MTRQYLVQNALDYAAGDKVGGALAPCPRCHRRAVVEVAVPWLEGVDEARAEALSPWSYLRTLQYCRFCDTIIHDSGGKWLPEDYRHGPRSLVDRDGAGAEPPQPLLKDPRGGAGGSEPD